MSLPVAFFRRLFVVAFVALLAIPLLSLVQPPTASAQSYTSNSSYNPDVQVNDHTRAQSALIDFSAAIICQLVGVDIVDPHHGCLGIDQTTGKLGYNPAGNSPQLGGLLGMSGSMFAMVYTPPVTTGSYVQYLANNFGPGPKTYAASGDQGFNALESVRTVWVTMRNIAYLAFTLLFIFIGIAIMLRIKIDPRTVMSIQNQIPKVIIAILLVTFSYAIVGAMIDGMWAVTYAGINILTTDEKVDVGNDDMLILATDSTAATALKGAGASEDEINQLVQESQARAKTLTENWQKESGWDPAGQEAKEGIENITKETDKTVDLLANGVDAQGNTLSWQDIETRIRASWENNLSVKQVATANLNSTPLTYVSKLFSQAGGFGRFDGISGLSYKVGITVGDVISQTVASLLGLDKNLNCNAWPWNWGDCAQDAFFNIIKWVVGAIAFLIVAAAIFIALLRVWFNLIIAFVYIVIYTITGPLQIVAGLFPGSTMGFTRWFRAILAHLLVFPVVIFILLLARMMASNHAVNNPTGNTFLPPLIVNTNSFNNLGLLLAFGLILITPQMLTWVREAVKAKPGPVGPALAKGWSAGVGPGLAMPRFALNTAWRHADKEKGIDAGWARRFLEGNPSENGVIRNRVIRPLLFGGATPSSKH